MFNLNRPFLSLVRLEELGQLTLLEFQLVVVVLFDCVLVRDVVFLQITLYEFLLE